MSLVDEIQAAPKLPTLRERAKAAKEAAKQARLAAEEEQVEYLTDCLWGFMSDELQVPGGDLMNADLTVGYYGGEPSSSQSPLIPGNRTVSMTIDGVKIRCRFIAVAEREPGDPVMFEYGGRVSTWSMVSSLAHLGALMGTNG